MDEIRQVDASGDAHSIAEIYAPYVTDTTITFETTPPTEEEMCERIRKIASRYPYLVYEEDDVIKGYAYAHPWKEKDAYFPTWETTIYLHPSAQSRGIGRRLMETLANECARRGCRSLIACITAENESSRRFHESLGFRQVSLFREVGCKFGRFLDVADYQKILTSRGCSSESWKPSR